MDITITHTRCTPQWSDLERVVAASLDCVGHFQRIARADGGHNYRLYGVYHCDFIPVSPPGAMVRVVVNIQL